MKYTVTHTVNDEYVKLGLIAKIIFGGQDVGYFKTFPAADLVCHALNDTLTSAT
jgi:hypothetical protein